MECSEIRMSNMISLLCGSKTNDLKQTLKIWDLKKNLKRNQLYVV